MKILLMGVGMQGKAALYDLVNSTAVTKIIAADWDIEVLKAYLDDKQYGDKVQVEHVNATSTRSINRLMSQNPDVVIDLLPTFAHTKVAKAAIKHGVHLVNASYTTPEIKALANKAAKKNLSFLPECGLDPGLDLVLLGQAVRSLDSVQEIITYGAGIPEAEAANTPIKYKVSWTFEGVLKAYYRAGQIIENGEVVEIKKNEMFHPKNVHEVEVNGLGKLESYPNGDALKYADLLGLEINSLQKLGRYVFRWPGHCAFWRTLIDLHLLDDEPITVDNTTIDRKRFLAAIIEPHIQYDPNERDIVIIRIDVKGKKDNKTQRLIYQMVDKRDLKTGFTAMSRTVGYTASIGAQMLGSGQITKRGLLSPVKDIPYSLFVDELKKRDIEVTTEIKNA